MTVGSPSGSGDDLDAELARLLSEDYLGVVADRPTEEIRAMRRECQAAETTLSYLRRLVQGRHDIVVGELERRRTGGAPGDLSALIERLPQILADRTRTAGPGRLLHTMEPGELSGRLVTELDRIAVEAQLHEPDHLSEAELDRIGAGLGELEHEVSTLRRSLFDRIDVLAAELTRRYKTGEATVDSLH